MSLNENFKKATSYSELKRLCFVNQMGAAEEILELRQRLREIDWKPIESVPKAQYTYVDLWVPADDEADSRCLSDCHWREDQWQTSDGSYLGRDLKPSHWKKTVGPK